MADRNIFILSKLGELKSCTYIGTELAVGLIQNGLIDAEQMDLLMDSRTPSATRATHLYTRIVPQWESEQFENFKTVLKSTGNSRALQILSDFGQAPTSPTANKSNFVDLDVYNAGKLFCLIVNVPTGRPGSEKDALALEETFKGCDFDVQKCTDWTKQGITTSLEQFRQLVTDASKKADIGGVFVALASHGDLYDYFKTSDDHVLDVYTDVIDLFNGIHSPELQEVPKVFLVNVCRGDKVDSRVHTDSYSPSARPSTQVNSRSWDTWLASTPSRIETDSKKITKPTWTNLLVAFASYDGHVAYRDPVDGTWFFQEFCQVLKSLANNNPTCIKRILDKVSDIISEKSTEKGEKQMPTWKNIGFTKSLLVNYSKST